MIAGIFNIPAHMINASKKPPSPIFLRRRFSLSATDDAVGDELGAGA